MLNDQGAFSVLSERRICEVCSVILIIYAHPYPEKSSVNSLMLRLAANNPEVVIRSLYDLYPDFDINVEAEQMAVEKADLLVLQHPLHWYNYPPLLKLWIDKVFTSGWAYGVGAAALKNKYLLWAVTMGEEHDQFEGGEYPGFPVLAQPLQATANYCGMHWLRPVAIHGTYQADHAALIKQIRRYGERLATWREV